MNSFRRIESWLLTIALITAMVATTADPLTGQDWPTYRHSVNRAGSTTHRMAHDLRLAWQRQLDTPRPAWPASQTKLQFDAGPNIVAAAGRVYVPSSSADNVTALDTASGDILWRFFVGGPVRFAPVATAERVYFVSDDGFLYCLHADSGELAWRVFGGPEQRWILGNDRLISSWPARGGPVLQEGVIYFAAGIWPTMGIFVHAIDAETGSTLWMNGGQGSDWTIQPHGASAFASVCPQGHLAVNDTFLIVPGGRSVPAIFDLQTGAKIAFDYDGKKGGHTVFATKDQLHVGGASYRLHSGEHLADETPAVADAEQLFFGSAKSLSARSIACDHEVTTRKDRLGKTRTTKKLIREVSFDAETTVDVGRILLKTPDHLVTAHDRQVHIFLLDELQAFKQEPISPAATLTFSEPVYDAIVADGRLLVTTHGGEVACFRAAAADAYEAKPIAAAAKPVQPPSHATAGLGFLVLFGASDSLLASALSDGRPIVLVEHDADRVRTLREQLHAKGIYGHRVSAKLIPEFADPLPSYFAGRVLAETAAATRPLPGPETLKRILRPYGGTAELPLSAKEHAELAERVKSWSGFALRRDGDMTLLSRPGPLPNAGQWTHQYADATQSGISDEAVVKAPLGVLWFGGPSNDKILPRHGHGPSPQVAGGRIVIEGPDMLRALDAYTGRLIWEVDLPNLGKYYNTTKHFPGAGEIGSNYVTLADAIYVAYGNKLLKLNAADGVELAAVENSAGVNWGYVGVSGDTLVATSSPLGLSELDPNRAATSTLEAETTQAEYASASRRLMAFDRHTLRELWTRDARHNFRHNAVALSKDMLFVIDRFSDEKRKSLKRRGVLVQAPASLMALNLRDGEIAWETDEQVFGTFLSYSVEHDILLEAGSLYRDRAYDEIGKGMIAYRGSSGEVLWVDNEVSYRGPCLLWKDQIITNGAGGFAIDLRTGKQTGWTYSRKYGCNTAIGCQTMLTFRSGAAGYYDLLADAGTSNLGGFRSSCTNNLIPADGLLCAPDYTRTCNCAYQNQTSIAFIHWPAAEQWSFGGSASPGAIGLNFGAPGDRRAPNGTLWLDYPSVGGSSPDLARLKIRPQQIRTLRRHPSEVDAELPWVYASAVTGLRRIKIPSDQLKGKFLVRLYVAELDGAEEARHFTCKISAEQQIEAFDVEVGRPRVFQREVSVNGKIAFDFDPPSQSQLNGLEIIRIGP